MQTVELGIVNTVGELRKRLSAFADDCPIREYGIDDNERLCLYYCMQEDCSGSVVFTVEDIDLKWRT
jgi:hypothetical protein